MRSPGFRGAGNAGKAGLGFSRYGRRFIWMV